MDRPKLLETSVVNGGNDFITYHLDGELVPVLTVELNEGQKVFFEHHILLWKNVSIKIGIRPMKGMLKRMVAGMQIFITEAEGPGQISFSRDGAGHIFALHIKPGEGIQVREHQFLAATNNVDYSFERIKGFSNILFGGTGFFIDKFNTISNEGIVWLHGYGNVFEKVLAPGEQIDVEPGGWLYKDSSVKMDTNVQSLSTGLLASMNIITNRFTGPGRVGIQSMYIPLPSNPQSN
jgi:uncharacterized protein (AIM24 family)